MTLSGAVCPCKEALEKVAKAVTVPQRPASYWRLHDEKSLFTLLMLFPLLPVLLIRPLMAGQVLAKAVHPAGQTP
jgi:hypothetical protein